MALATRPQPHWRVLAGFLAIVGGTQLWDALLWRTPDNARLSQLAAVHTYAEPLAYWLLAAWLLAPRSATRARLAGWTVGAYAVLAAIATVRFVMRPAEKQRARVGPGDALVWPWLTLDAGATLTVLFVLSFVLTSYAFLPQGLDHAVALIMMATFGASYVRYWDEGALGRMWCFYAAFTPWLLVLMPPSS